MLSIQHAMCSALYFKSDNSIEFNEHLGYILLPDAIRAYSGARQYSHFEMSRDGSDTSYWSFPCDIKHCTKESIQKDINDYGHLVSDIKPCAIGEDTDIGAFYATNEHLPEVMFTGIEMHLKQDIVFDAFIRDEIDCSDKYNDVYRFNGQQLNGANVRSLIGDIEQHGIYILAHMVFKETGIKITNNWISDIVSPILYEEYPEDLADKTLGFMHIRDDINQFIESENWAHLDEGLIPRSDYEEMYSRVINYMHAISYSTFISSLGNYGELDVLEEEDDLEEDDDLEL